MDCCLSKSSKSKESPEFTPRPYPEPQYEPAPDRFSVDPKFPFNVKWKFTVNL